MTVIPAISSPIALVPKQHEWTKEEYQAMGKAGIFRNRRVELIEGRVIDMSPIGSRHAAVVTLGSIILSRIGRGTHVRTQQPIDLLPLSEPEPDLALVVGTPLTFMRSHPSQAALIVEVADSSLDYDLGDKAGLYAKAGQPDYWVIDLLHQQIHVLREPLADPAGFHGFAYTKKLKLVSGEKVSLLAFPDVAFDVAEFLP